MGKKNADRQYKAEVPALNEQQIMEEWTSHLLPAEGDRIGRWRPLHGVRWDPPKGSWTRKEGLLVKNEIQWDLYFHKRADFNIEARSLFGKS